MNAEMLARVAQDYCQQRQIEFIRELGQGAVKCAYLVRQDASPVALKIAELHESSTERLTREITALRACDHVGIARLRDAEPFVYDGKRYWVVLEEFLSGDTLERRLANGVLPPAEVRRLGVALVDVIGHLHQRKLVHRDIKPANILFRDDQTTPVLTDFGIVRALDSPTITQDFLTRGPGTPFYAASEQLNNEKALIDWRTDQFGLAVVLVHCAIGRHPFQTGGRHVRDAVEAVAKRESLAYETTQLLTALNLAALCKALQPWPIGRYRKPAEFAAALSE